MRYVAVARFRLLTTIRSATPIFIIAAIPPLLAAIYQSMPEPLFRAAADEVLGPLARAAVVAWLFHGLLVVAASEASGSKQPFRVDPMSLLPDLMDSVPIGPLPRFWGEALGIFTATLTIHICCLPLLAAVAVLSPLPTIFFVWMEAGILALMTLTSAAGAWKRLAPRTQWGATRVARSGLLFFILLVFVLFATTKWTTFRDSWFMFLITPSTRTWDAVAAAVENPTLLVVLLLLLYVGYMAYFVNSARKPAQT